MSDDPLLTALDRLERAVIRIEALEQIAQAPARGLAEAYSLLDERHGMLRLRIQETIDRLDGLIGRADARAEAEDAG